MKQKIQIHEIHIFIIFSLNILFYQMSIKHRALYVCSISLYYC